jgi:hypothetical protein
MEMSRLTSLNCSMRMKISWLNRVSILLGEDSSPEAGCPSILTLRITKLNYCLADAAFTRHLLLDLKFLNLGF